MTAPRPIGDLLVSLIGPIAWLGHFFGLYLSEALLCTGPGPANGTKVQLTYTGLTVVAMAVVAFGHGRRHGLLASGSDKRAAHFAFAGPLTILSILAMLWTSVPVFLLPACVPAGG